MSSTTSSLRSNTLNMLRNSFVLHPANHLFLQRRHEAFQCSCAVFRVDYQKQYDQGHMFASILLFCLNHHRAAFVTFTQLECVCAWATTFSYIFVSDLRFWGVGGHVGEPPLAAFNVSFASRSHTNRFTTLQIGASVIPKTNLSMFIHLECKCSRCSSKAATSTHGCIVGSCILSSSAQNPGRRK